MTSVFPPKTRTTARRRLLLSVAALMLPTAAIAEEPVHLGTIVISPSHWSETALQSATDATVIFGADLDQPQAPDLDLLAARAGNVMFQRANSGERLVVRGISAFDNALSDPVGYLVNGVSLPLGTMQLPHFFATDQVVLLKGPQGTAFGRNTEAGLVIYDTLRAGDFIGWKLGLGVSGSDRGAKPLGYSASLLWGGEVEGGPALLLGFEQARTDGVMSDPRVGGGDKGGRDRRTSLTASAAWNLDNGATLRLSFIGEDQDMGKEQFRCIDGLQATGRYESRYSDPSWETRRSTITSLEYGQSFDGFERLCCTIRLAHGFTFVRQRV
ncbi:TonB-dependent receptor plug domain-containing protein, partial [Paracoccus sp. IB05]|uniref:TonB-dependent receptor plug domain-containing protein n=1 Tax=Paracoccus sp. IB05 TaxID=2779367 RepID=UPI001A2E9993|nr:TonB-dependent receptor [Paracoccus sp. IB05]